MSAVAEALRVSYPKLLSTLVRVTGSLDEAEDLLQQATAKALLHWEDAGVPDNPAAWLVTAARSISSCWERVRAAVQFQRLVRDLVGVSDDYFAAKRSRISCAVERTVGSASRAAVSK